ncbi:MAG: phytanoyl-CoA dioxygenase family protein [Cytophagaceae bacterium]|nr:phytanoyl-CoA dioxygenase family protein [Cytophagaceae bacterium]
MLTPQQLQHYHEQGYVVVPSLFSKAEADLLLDTSTSDTVISEKSYELLDASGFKTRLALWYTPGDDVYGTMSRSRRIVSAVEQLLGGPVAHYHSKVMQKAPRTGGAWEWHQDYGYWYKNGFLFPDMLSVMIALTPSVTENGCLQVLPGSHRMGRVEHLNTGEQVGADSAKVEAYAKLHELVYCELQPGDALFFHCNLLHSSGQNRSENPRWSIISAYNRTDNRAYLPVPESSFTPLEVVDDDQLLAVGAKGITASADFLDKSARKYQESD